MRVTIRGAEDMTIENSADLLLKAVAAIRRGPVTAAAGRRVEVEHHSLYQPRDAATGRWVERLSEQRQSSAADRAGLQQQAYTDAIRGLVERQEAGEFTPGQTQWRFKRFLRHHYQTLFELGKQAAGDPIVPTDDELGLLERTIREQFGYVNRFTQAVDADQGKLQYDDRAHMHGMHARVAYWLGWVCGNLDPTRRIRWEMHPDKEHCTSCVSMATHGDVGAGVWTPEGLLRTGLLPHSGRLECRGYHCGCDLTEEFVRGERAGGEGVPGGAEWQERPRKLNWNRTPREARDDAASHS